MEKIFKKLGNTLYKSINEAFDFNDLEDNNDNDSVAERIVYKNKLEKKLTTFFQEVLNLKNFDLFDFQEAELSIDKDIKKIYYSTSFDFKKEIADLYGQDIDINKLTYFKTQYIPIFNQLIPKQYQQLYCLATTFGSIKIYNPISNKTYSNIKTIIVIQQNYYFEEKHIIFPQVESFYIECLFNKFYNYYNQCPQLICYELETLYIDNDALYLKSFGELPRKTWETYITQYVEKFQRHRQESYILYETENPEVNFIFNIKPEGQELLFGKIIDPKLNKYTIVKLTGNAKAKYLYFINRYAKFKQYF